MILTIFTIILLIILGTLTLMSKNISKISYIIILIELIISLILTSYYRYKLIEITDRYNQAEEYKQQLILEQDSKTNNRDTRIGDDL